MPIPSKYKTTSAVELPSLIKLLGPECTGVELGVWTGHNMAYLLEQCNNIKMLFGIDPYKPYQDWNRYIDKQVMENAKQTAINNLIDFKDRSKLLVTTSQEASTLLDNLDFIFIDGDHSFEMCYNDLNLWYDKVRPGGLFSGHDFTLEGVNKALLKFRTERNIKGFFKVIPNDVWYWIKD